MVNDCLDKLIEQFKDNGMAQMGRTVVNDQGAQDIKKQVRNTTTGS